MKFRTINIHMYDSRFVIMTIIIWMMGVCSGKGKKRRDVAAGLRLRSLSQPKTEPPLSSRMFEYLNEPDAAYYYIILYYTHFSLSTCAHSTIFSLPRLKKKGNVINNLFMYRFFSYYLYFVQFVKCNPRIQNNCSSSSEILIWKE